MIVRKRWEFSSFISVACLCVCVCVYETVFLALSLPFFFGLSLHFAWLHVIMLCLSRQHIYSPWRQGLDFYHFVRGGGSGLTPSTKSALSKYLFFSFLKVWLFFVQVLWTLWPSPNAEGALRRLGRLRGGGSAFC